MPPSCYISYSNSKEAITIKIGSLRLHVAADIAQFL